MNTTSKACSLEEVIVTDELLQGERRAENPPETQAFLALSQTLSSAPHSVVQRLVQLAMELTNADSAGVSLEDTDNGEEVFRWVATEGEFSRYLHGTIPRLFSPCAAVLERGEPVLMREPARHYPYAMSLHVPVQWALLAPFSAGGKPVGTVWVLLHSDSKSFSAQDLRLLQSLAAFASAVSDTIEAVSALRKAERESKARLASSEDGKRLLEEYFKQSPDFVALLRGPSHVFELVNDSYLRLVGRPAGEVVGKPVFDALPDVRDQGFEQLLDGVFQTGTGYVGRGVSVQFSRDDGTLDQRYVDISYSAIRDKDAGVLGIFAQGHDVTEQHRTSERLKEADAGKNRFLAVLSHELRNPLGAIRLAAQVLKRTDGKDDPRQQRTVATLENQSAVLTRLVDDLLDVSRVTSGKLRLEMAHVSLKEVVARALEACQPQFAAKQHGLDVEVENVIVNGDGTRLCQVLINLLTNAARYSPPGSQVYLSVRREGPEAVIQVRDNGDGIAPEFLPHVFEMYSQDGAELPEHGQGGLGLGLALVRQLVEMHKGTVTAGSEGAGKGACFTVRLSAVT